MTFKDLQKFIQSQNSPEQNGLLDRLRNKLFWIWNKEEHKQEDIKTKGECCFNHIIGLPRKDGIEKPLFDYEKMLYDDLFISQYHNPPPLRFKEKHLWVKKATTKGIDTYLQYRQRCGEKINFINESGRWEPGDIPLIRLQFDVNNILQVRNNTQTKLNAIRKVLDSHSFHLAEMVPHFLPLTNSIFP